MRNIIALFAIAISVFMASPSHAQTYGTITSTACPPVIPAASGSNVFTLIDCRANKHISGCFSALCNSNTTVTFNLVKTLDGTTNQANCESVPSWIVNLVIPATQTNGTAIVTTNVDLDVGAVGWLFLRNVSNSATAGTSSTVSNVGAVFGLKPGY